MLRQEYSTSVWVHRSCHSQVSSVLQKYMVNDLLLVAIDLRNHDLHHKIVLEGRLYLDQYSKLLLAAIWQLIRSPGLVNAGNRSVGDSSVCLGNLAAPIWPRGICIFVGLDGKYPSSGHIILRLGLPHINEIKNLIFDPVFPLKVFRLSKLLVVSSYFLG